MVYNYCEHITDNIESFDIFDICKIDYRVSDFETTNNYQNTGIFHQPNHTSCRKKLISIHTKKCISYPNHNPIPVKAHQ